MVGFDSRMRAGLLMGVDVEGEGIGRGREDDDGSIGGCVGEVVVRRRLRGWIVLGIELGLGNPER